MAENQNYSATFAGSTESDIGLICLQVCFLMPQITAFIPLTKLYFLMAPGYFKIILFYSTFLCLFSAKRRFHSANVGSLTVWYPGSHVKTGNWHHADKRTPFLRRQESLGWYRNSPPFMEPQSSLPCSYQPDTAPYPEPCESVHKITYFNIVLQYTPRYLKWLTYK
jgi:hypothetical protein